MNLKILIALLISMMATASFAGLNCSEVLAAQSGPQFASEYAYEPVGKFLFIVGQYNKFSAEWSQLPKSEQELASFNPQKFTLLVHAGSSPSKIQRLLDNNALLQQEYSFSASLINQNHRSTFGQYGVVLAAPPENILGTRSSDMGSPLGRSFLLEEKRELQTEIFYPFIIDNNVARPPEEVLANTKDNDYNEIMVAGTTANAGSVKIIGLFLKTKNGQIQAPADIVNGVKILSQQLQVPIIQIETDSARPF